MENYEQKLKEIINSNNTPFADIKILSKYFPELKESEDERVRKECISIIDAWDKSCKLQGDYCEVASECIAWLEKQGKKIDAIENFDTEFEKQVSCLIASSINKEHEYNQGFVKWVANALLNYAKHELEKQGEQKPFDYENANIQQKDFAPNGKSKFKVGDWVVASYGKVNQVVSVDKDGNGYTLDDGMYFSGSWCNKYHLWTIQDAKDGDVLATNNGGTCIFDGTVEGGIYPFAYCGITKYGFESYDRKLPFTHDSIHPATTVQCDLLFQKMHEAGYEWDAEKKELKKIEQKSFWSEEEGLDETKQECGSIDVSSSIKTARIETLENILSYFTYERKTTQEEINTSFIPCLENLLKDVENTNDHASWSEEDEEMVETLIINALGELETYGGDFSKQKNWLKSLKERYTWKPSDEQMNALNLAIGDANSVDTAAGDEAAETLTSLYDQLEKLREE